MATWNRFARIRGLCVFTLAISTASPAESHSLKPSQLTQVRLGIQAAASIRKTEKLLPTTDGRVKTVRAIGMRLLSCFHDKAPWQWSFDVIDSHEINAFSLPGGPTFVFTGLLDKLKTEDEVAAVLGHEMTHVRREHWAKAYGNEEFRSIGLGVLLGVFHASDDVYSATGILNNIFSLRFSQKDESQADEGGFELMTQAGFNPEGMSNVFRTLEDAQRSGSVPEFLSDHPSDKHRIARIEGLIKQSGKDYPEFVPLSFEAYERYFPDYFVGIKPEPIKG